MFLCMQLKIFVGEKFDTPDLEVKVKVMDTTHIDNIEHKSESFSADPWVGKEEMDLC